MIKNKITKKLIPEELLFTDCPNCGQEINYIFVQSVLQKVWNKAIDSVIKEAKKSKY